MSRIKVFYFIPSLIQGGAERQMLELIRRLPERFEPVLGLYDPMVHYRDMLPPGEPRYVFGSGSMTPAGFFQLVQALRAERPQIFHSYLDRANFWGRLAALWAGVPVIISSCRARMMEWRYLAVERLLSDRCQRVVVNSVGIQRELTRVARVRPEQIQVLHNFLDQDYFRPPTAQERQRARARWDIPEGRRVLLMPGRICIQKHQLGLLLAMDILARRGELPEQTLVVLPGRGRGAATDRLVQRLAQGRRLADAVRIPGVISDIRSLYWAADVLVMTSLWEGLPNAALEGCACGLPALLSHAANLDGIVAVGENGWEVPTGDHRSLAQVLPHVLSAPAAALAEMGRRSRRRMERMFDATRIMSQLVGCYDTLITRAKER